MNAEQKKLCEARYRNGEYDPSPEWREYERAWENYKADCVAADATDDYETRASIAASYGVDAVQKASSFVERPTISAPSKRMVEKFEHRWLQKNHKELLDYYAHKPGRLEVALWNLGFLLFLLSMASALLYYGLFLNRP